MVRVDVLLTENEMAAEFLSAVENRNLPEKFFYWFPLSVKAWLDICSDGSYRNFVRSYGLVERHAGGVASRLPRGDVDVLSLGAGQGDKDILLLDALRRAGASPRYRPVDSSQALLEMACARAGEAGLPCEGTKADIGRADHLAAIGGPGGRPARLLLLLGNTLGAFDPMAFAGRLQALLRPGDWLLIDGEIFLGEKTILGYDNPLNRRFAFAPLKSIGITENDGELVFENVEDERKKGLYKLAKHFLPARDLVITLAGERLTLPRGERIEMNFSYKYTREAFLDIVLSIGDLSVTAEYASDDGGFLMVLASIRGA